MAPDIDPIEAIHPPRWADALLRSFLTPDNAETISGDLLEAYRDSIHPLRGRRQADLWYLQQVAGCLVRATTPMNLRNWILAGLTLGTLILVFSILMYPSPPSDHVESAIPAWVFAGFLFYAYAAIWRTRAVASEDELVLRLGTKWGLAIGTLWIAAHILLNLRYWEGLLVALTAIALSFVCGAHGAIKTWKIRNGMRVGFWSGLVSGLMVFLVFAVAGYIFAFVPGLPGAEIPRSLVYTATEYQRLNIFDCLGGGLSHLFGIGGVLAVIDGMVAGCAGLLLARTGLTPEEKSRLPHWF